MYLEKRKLDISSSQTSKGAQYLMAMSPLGSAQHRERA